MFFLQDLTGGALAAALLTIFLFAPGWLVGWGLDVAGFRARGLAMRAALAVVLSVAVTPAVAYLGARTGGTWPAIAGFLALAAGTAVVAARVRARGGARGEADPLVRQAAVVAALWAGVALLLLSDTQIGGRLYTNLVAFDYAKHISVTNAITRTGVPPVNPSFDPGRDLPLYYYYFWFLVCSLADTLGGRLVDARMAVLGGTVWAGLALVSIVALYARFVVPPLAPDGFVTRRRIWTAAALLLVGGCDAITAPVDMIVGRGAVSFTLEWWNEQVTAWPNAVLWVPHHVGAFVATLAGFLLLRDAEGRSVRARGARAVVCGLAFASAAGMSVWVTLTFALFWAVWITVCLARGWRAEAVVAVAAGAVAVVAAAPFLVDLARASLLDERPILLSVRAFGPLDRALDASGAGDLRRQVYRLAALPVNYLVELGFAAFAAGWYWMWRHRARRPLTRGELGVVVLGVVGLLVASFCKSAIRSNDLGWRSVFYVQFAVLLWATDVVPALRRTRAATAAGFAMAPWARRALRVALVVGGVTVAYELSATELYPLGRLVGAQFFGAEPWEVLGNGRRLYEIRAAYAWIDSAFPSAAVVQPDPTYDGVVPYTHRRVDVLQGLYGRRGVVAGDPEYGTLYGIPTPMFAGVAAPIEAAFASAAAAPAAEVCRRHAISALLVKDDNPVWTNRASWAWQTPPLYANGTARVISCAALMR